MQDIHDHERVLAAGLRAVAEADSAAGASAVVKATLLQEVRTLRHTRRASLVKTYTLVACLFLATAVPNLSTRDTGAGRCCVPCRRRSGRGRGGDAVLSAGLRRCAGDCRKHHPPRGSTGGIRVAGPGAAGRSRIAPGPRARRCARGRGRPRACRAVRSAGDHSGTAGATAMTSAISRVCIGACIVAAMPAPAGAQTRGGANPAERVLEGQRFYLNGQELRLSTNDPLTGPLVTDAPFSADATTTVTQTLGDGTRIEQNTTARFYRDRAGRVRREQTILGLGNLNRGDGVQTITILTDPATRAAYTLDPTARTARRTPPVGFALCLWNPSVLRILGRCRGGRPHGGSSVGRSKSGDRRIAWNPSDRGPEGGRPKDNDGHSGWPDWQRPADRDHR